MPEFHQYVHHPRSTFAQRTCTFLKQLKLLCVYLHLRIFIFANKNLASRDAGVTWMVYQDEDNFGDDALSSFTQYMNAGPDDPLTLYGNSYPGLDKFYADAAAGTLPQVSWIVGPAE